MIVWIVLGLLFITQIIGFYFLALLYTKVSKFDDLEKKQRKLMSEMDDSIGVYLSELKDENERLIERLVVHEKESITANADKKLKHTVLDEQKKPAVTTEQTPRILRNKPIIPVNVALKSYHGVATPQPEPVIEKEDERTQVITLFDAGQSIEEIARIVGKGKTEVELILKFR